MNCPVCSSVRITKKDLGKRTGGVIGSIGGAASGVSSVLAGGEAGAAIGAIGGPLGIALPVYVQLQVMHQLAVTGKQAADVAVLLGGQHLEIHRIERDEELIGRLIELERDFWGYVQRDTPPPADGSESAEQALRCLYPEDHGSTLDFSEHSVLSAAFDELQCVRANLEMQGKREAELKQQLQQAMGDSSRALFANGSALLATAAGHRPSPTAAPALHALDRHAP